MIHKYSSSNIPKADNLNETDLSLIELPEKIYDINNVQMNNYQFNIILENIWKIIRSANSYVDNNEPWNLHKNNDSKRLNNVLFTLVNTIYKITILLQPFLPESSKKIFNLLKQKKEISFSEIKSNIKEGIKLEKSQPIFPRFYKKD